MSGTAIVLIVIVLAVIGAAVLIYNGLVQRRLRIDEAWAQIQVVIPTASSLANLSGAFSATLYPLYAMMRNAITIKAERKKPSSTAVTAKIESVAASGR